MTAASKVKRDILAVVSTMSPAQPYGAWRAAAPRPSVTTTAIRADKKSEGTPDIPSTRFDSVSSAVAFFANGVGDHLLVLPALRAVSAMLPDKLTLLCRPGAREAFFADLPLRACIETQLWYDDDRLLAFDAEGASQAAGACDLFISMVQWGSPSLETLQSHLRPAVAVGFQKHCDFVVPRVREKHTFEQLFDIPTYLWPHLHFERYANALKFSKKTREMAAKIRRATPRSIRVLAVHPETSPEKMWALPNFVRVLDRLFYRHQDIIAFVVSERDQHLDCGRYSDRVISCHGLPLPVAFCLVAEADWFIGIDSCMLHVADLCRVPGVGLFCQTNAAEWGFRIGPHRHVVASGAMRAIPEGDVYDAVEWLLSHYPTRAHRRLIPNRETPFALS